MNCPEHRRKMEYVREISRPKEGVTFYYCVLCEGLWSFMLVPMKSKTAIRLGVSIRKLKRAGFEPELNMKRSV